MLAVKKPGYLLAASKLPIKCKIIKDIKKKRC